MIDLERSFGYTSTFYLLNGKGGRFGARSGSVILDDLINVIPHEWDIGMHYNYDTMLDHERFSAQFDELKNIVPSAILTGRAHYLRFDSEKSLPFIESYGIKVDESAGYSDRIGYRCGVAGCFKAYDTKSEKPMDIHELPMIVMDNTILNQYRHDAVDAFKRLLGHIKHIGGALTLVVHPGGFHNPEHKEMLGFYHKILIECRQLGAVSKSALSLIDE
jgi:hypothetical protein